MRVAVRNNMHSEAEIHIDMREEESEWKTFDITEPDAMIFKETGDRFHLIRDLQAVANSIDLTVGAFSFDRPDDIDRISKLYWIQYLF